MRVAEATFTLQQKEIAVVDITELEGQAGMAKGRRHILTVKQSRHIKGASGDNLEG